MKARTVTSVLMITLLMIGIWGGCSRTDLTRNPFALVPISTVAFASLNLLLLRNDAFLSELVSIRELMPVLESVGLELRSLSRMIVLGDGGAGLILLGDYRAASVIDHLKRQGAEVERFHQDSIYRLPGTLEYWAQIDRRAVMVGSRQTVEGVLQVQRERAESIQKRTDLQPIFQYCQRADTPIVAALFVPQSAADVASAGLDIVSGLLSLFDLGAIGQLMQQIGIAQGMGMTIRHEGPQCPVTLMIQMKDEAAAKLVSGSLNLLKGLTELAPQERRTSKPNIPQMQVDRDGSLLRVEMILSEQEFNLTAGSTAD